MLVVALIWAGNNVLTKAVLNERIGPLPYVFCRLAIVSMLLFAWLRLRGVDLRVRREDYRQFALTGITGYAAYNLLFVVGLSHTSAFSAAIMISLGPIFALIFAAALRLELVRPAQWLGVAAAFGGVALFVGQGITGRVPALGDALNILAAACFAAYGLAVRPLVRHYGSAVVTAWSVLLGLLGSLPITAPAVLREDWGRVGFAGWAALLYAGVLSMLVAYTIWGWAIERRGVGRTVPYLYLVPVVTGVLAMLYLGERFDAAKLAGATLVLVGVGLARRGAGEAPVGRRSELQPRAVAEPPGPPVQPSPSPGP